MFFKVYLLTCFFNNTLPGSLGTGAVLLDSRFHGKDKKKGAGCCLLDSRFHEKDKKKKAGCCLLDSRFLGKDKGFLFKKNKLLTKRLNPQQNQNK